MWKFEKWYEIMVEIILAIYYIEQYDEFLGTTVFVTFVCPLFHVVCNAPFSLEIP